MGETVDPKELADKIFSIDRSIRYVGIIGPAPKYELLESRMRENVKSLTPKNADSDFVEIIPEIILGAAGKLGKDLGAIAYSLIRYRNVTLVFFKASEYTITLSIEPEIPVEALYERIRLSILSQDLLCQNI